MGWPFPDNDDLAGQYDDPDPDEIPRCPHGIVRDSYGFAACDECAEAASQADYPAELPFASNH